MAEYYAVMMHGRRDGEGIHRFEDADDLLDRSPARVAQVFMRHLEEQHPAIGHIDYELNAALKNPEKRVVTILGNLIFERDGAQPFTCFISDPPDTRP